MGILNSEKDRLLKMFADLDDVVSDAGRDVLIERRRQIAVEGWTPEHDDEHELGEMAIAAACYAHKSTENYEHEGALYPIHEQEYPPDDWPWSPRWWKPQYPRRDLVRAAALIIAEIERIDRAEKR